MIEAADLRARRAPAWLAGVVLLAWFFGPVFAGREFAFRDTAHYYRPLWAWQQREWRAGRVPLWNPQENLGAPVAANPAASTFYPGQLLFFVPGLAFPTQLALYVAVHAALAFAATYRLARAASASRPAATIAGLTYAFGGPVLFQHCNAVYLVGAAWLPVVLGTAERTLIEARPRSAVACGAALALLSLGGDPQSAYHAALLAAGYAFLRRTGATDAPALPPTPRFRGELLLAGAAIVGAVLAAVQILPARDAARASSRATFVVPRSVYEIPSYLRRDEHAGWSGVRRGLFARPEPHTHHDHVFQFSVGPWRLAECLWPNVTGRMLPIHRRWLNALPAEGRIWSPSLYCGLLPFVLALAAFHLRSPRLPPSRRRRLLPWGDAPEAGAFGWAVNERDRFLSWGVLLATLASFGQYGIGWVIEEFRCGPFRGDPAQPWIGEQVGGVYWLATVLLPDYVAFRYPAKWLVPACLLLALLAARGWDRTFREGRPPRRLLRGIAVASLAGTLVALGLVSGPWWTRWIRAVPADAVFGPCDPSGASFDLVVAFAQATVVAWLGLWLLRGCSTVPLLRRTRRNSAPRSVGPSTASPSTAKQRHEIAALVLVAADLALANGSLVPTMPRSTPDTTQPADALAPRLFRGTRTNSLPAEWSQTGSAERLAEVAAWERATVFPQYHLSADVSSIDVPGSLMRADYAALLRVARSFGPRRADGVAEPHRAVLDLLGVERLVEAHGADRRAASVAINPQPLPRAWIVHRVETLSTLVTDDPRALERRAREVLFPAGAPRDFREEAVVETDDPPVPLPTTTACSHLAPRDEPFANQRRLHEAHLAERDGYIDRSGSTCRIEAATPTRLTLSAELSAPGLLVVADTYDPDWQVTVATTEQPPRSATLERANRVMRGVWLPAGRSRVEMHYVPTRLRVGAFVSVVGWCLVVGWGLTTIGRRGGIRSAGSSVRRARAEP